MKKAAVVVGLLMIGLVVSPGLWSQDKGRCVFGGRCRPQHGEGGQDRSHHERGRPFGGKNAKRSDSKGEAVASRNSRQSPKGQPGISCGEHRSYTKGWSSGRRDHSDEGR